MTLFIKVEYTLVSSLLYFGIGAISKFYVIVRMILLLIKVDILQLSTFSYEVCFFKVFIIYDS